MDGNGRWAAQNDHSRILGHREGARRVSAIVEECRRLGIRYLTLFCFSSENWNRPKEEVAALMLLFGEYLEAEIPRLIKNKVRLRVIGDHGALPAALRLKIAEAERLTADSAELQLILAVSYGGRDEIVHAVRGIASDLVSGKFGAVDSTSVDKIVTSESLRSYFYAPDVPDPDMLIRSSGEHRISNFLLWQLAYSEIVVTEALWPEVTVAEFHKCIREYFRRSRRFGLTADQLEQFNPISSGGLSLQRFESLAAEPSEMAARG